MQIIDVTLRDGGHVRNFNWPIKFAQDHYKALCKIPEIKYVELGYWKQKSKSTNPFYNLDINKVITKNEVNKAYIKIQKKIHPDVSPETTRLSTIVNEAKEVVLKNIS